MNYTLSSLHTLALIAAVHQIVVICGMISLGIALFSFFRNASGYLCAKRLEAERRFKALGS